MNAERVIIEQEIARLEKLELKEVQPRRKYEIVKSITELKRKRRNT